MAIPAYREGQTYFIVGAGDSIANSYQMPSSTFGFQRYVSDVLGGQSWANRGINGQTTTQILARYTDDVYPYLPSIAIVEGGTNDYPTVPQATSIQNLKDMITGCLANGVLMVVWFKIMLDTNWSVPEQENAEAINAAVSSWITDNYPDGSVIEVNCDEIIDDRKTIDGLHPSAAGYEAIGQIIGTAIINA